MAFDWFNTVNFLLTECFLGGYIMLMIDLRAPARRWRARWLALILALVGLHGGLIFFGKFSLYTRFSVLMLVIPYTFATVWCSRAPGWVTAFAVANGFFIGCIGGLNGYAIQLALPSLPYAALVARMASFILLFFVMRRFRRTYRQMVRQLEFGWPVLTMIPFFACASVMYVKAALFPTEPVLATLIMYSLLLTCSFAYYLMFLFFERVQKENDAQHNKQLLEVQISALQSRIEAVGTAENALRMERHDLRHRLQTAAALVCRDDKAAALKFLDEAQTRLDEQKLTRWCGPAILDAMFSSYLGQAQLQGIQVDARISLPDPLPVDEGDLAIVLANALDNAIHACMKLAADMRHIRCKVISKPRLMLEIANSCDGSATFDADGLPVPDHAGHGMGAQSILAFCKKYNATCQFNLAGNRFSLIVVL